MCSSRHIDTRGKLVASAAVDGGGHHYANLLVKVCGAWASQSESYRQILQLCISFLNADAKEWPACQAARQAPCRRMQHRRHRGSAIRGHALQHSQVHGTLATASLCVLSCWRWVHTMCWRQCKTQHVKAAGPKLGLRQQWNVFRAPRYNGRSTPALPNTTLCLYSSPPSSLLPSTVQCGMSLSMPSGNQGRNVVTAVDQHEAHIVLHVGVSPRSQQELHHSCVPSSGGAVKRCPAVLRVEVVSNNISGSYDS
jgi:hypothetical protein